MADPSRAAMSHTYTATMSSTCTGASRSRTSSNSAAASDTASTAAPTATATTTAAISEQRAGRCDQQCLDGNYCKKLGYPRHDALLIRTQSDVSCGTVALI